MTPSIPKAVLYYAANDVWSAAVRLTLLEKGYDSHEIDLRLVDLAKAENYSLTFLRLSSKGDVPNLVVPMEDTLLDDVESRFKAITDTKTLLSFLDKSRSSRSTTHSMSSAPAPTLSPATVAFSSTTSAAVDPLHESFDPELLLFSAARDASELERLSKQLLPFVTSKHEALSTSLAGADQESGHISEKVKTLWREELKKTQRYIDLWSSSSSQDQEEYFAASALLNTKVKDFLVSLNKEMEGPLLLGDHISLGDLHIGAWLARVVRISGGSGQEDGNSVMEHIESFYGFQLPKDFAVEVIEGEAAPKQSKLALFWDTITTRPSWKEVFGGGLV